MLPIRQDLLDHGRILNTGDDLRRPAAGLANFDAIR
jgi:hypothetical protein